MLISVRNIGLTWCPNVPKVIAYTVFAVHASMIVESYLPGRNEADYDKRKSPMYLKKRA